MPLGPAIFVKENLVRETPGLLTALNQILEQQTYWAISSVWLMWHWGRFAHSHNDEVRCKRVPRCRERNQTR